MIFGFMKKTCFPGERVAGYAREMFLSGLMIYILCMSIRTTMFSLYTVTLLGKYLGVGIVALKILLYDRYSLKKLIIAMVLCAVAMVTFVFGGYGEPICLMVLILGAENMDFDDVIRAYIAVTLVVMTAALAGCIFGIIENIRFSSTESIAQNLFVGVYLLDSLAGINSFGIQYHTDFGAHIFYLWLSFIYLKRDELKLRYGCLAIVCGILVRIFSRARLDSVLLVALGVSELLFVFFRDRRKELPLSVLEELQQKKNLYMLGRLSMPVMFVLAFCATRFYNPENTVFVWIDDLFSGRLRIGQSGLDKYGISLTGQWIEMIGNGQANQVVGEYNFIDCAYLMILLQNGILFFAAIILLNQYIIIKFKNNTWMIFAWIFIAVSSTTDHHIMDTAYNVFLIAAGCMVLDKKIVNAGFSVIKGEV